MSNQSNYAHEKFWGDIKGSFKNKKKLNKSLLLLIMVGNKESIFTQVYIAKVTPIYIFFPHLQHTVPFTSLSLLWAHVNIFKVIFICSCHRPNVQWCFCLPFSRLKSSYQFHCNLRSKVKMNILFWLALLKSCSAKCRLSLCCICCTAEYFGADLLGSHYYPISHLCEQHFLGLNLSWQVLQFYCLAKQWPPHLSCHPDMICKHHGSFYQVYKYPLEDTSYSYCPFLVSSTSQ